MSAPATVPLAAMQATVEALLSYVPLAKHADARAAALAVSIGYAYPPSSAMQKEAGYTREPPP